MKKLMFAAVAALAMVGAAQAASSVQWTFDMSSMGTKNPVTIKDGFNATEVGGTSENSVGAGYAAYYIWGVDSTSYKTVGNSILSGIRAGKTVAQVISDEKMTLFATSQTDKDGYVASVKGNVDTSLYYKGGLDKDTDFLSVLHVVLAENDADYVFLDAVDSSAKYQTASGGAFSTNKLRDNTLKGSFSTGGWYAVPEPTSGLLLLLGVAGLALKRKRA